MEIEIEIEIEIRYCHTLFVCSTNAFFVLRSCFFVLVLVIRVKTFVVEFFYLRRRRTNSRNYGNQKPLFYTPLFFSLSLSSFFLQFNYIKLNVNIIPNNTFVIPNLESEWT